MRDSQTTSQTTSDLTKQQTIWFQHDIRYLTDDLNIYSQITNVMHQIWSQIVKIDRKYVKIMVTALTFLMWLEPRCELIWILRCGILFKVRLLKHWLIDTQCSDRPVVLKTHTCYIPSKSVFETFPACVSKNRIDVT